ncbi:MAG: ribosome biogenesis GTPase YlqF [Oscillospiraceae bacterium]|nr:ribosome biogenesis GTPase YlqF [Oscillospiraceae bacterium]
MNIQWYPGHMTKTRRQIEADLKLVDAVCELLDARIPRASRNPDIAAICGAKPRLVLLNRMDMADPELTRRWRRHFEAQGLAAAATDCKSRRGIAAFQPAVQQLLSERLRRYREKGQTGRALRVMVVGIPNVGKSTFINQVSGRKGAKAENRPGVTRGKQWVSVDRALLLLDTPGILWPKFEDPRAGELLAFTGAVKDDILDAEGLACRLAELLWRRYPGSLRDRYGLDCPPDAAGWTLLEAVGARRGFRVSGGEIDLERAARALLEEYRSGRLGRFTLETPEENGP